MKRHALAVTLGILVVVGLPSRQTVRADAPTTYTVTDLGSFNGLVPAVTGINRSGQLSGYVYAADGQHAIRFTPNIGWEQLPGLAAGSVATGLNDEGDVSGYQPVGSTTDAFRYRDGSGVEDITGTPNAVDAFGLGINNAGDVVGYSDTDVDTRGWRASPGVPAVQLPDLGGSFALACGINAAGQIVGTSGSSGASHAFRINVDGTTTDVESFDGPTGASDGCAIDEAGNLGGFAQLGGVDHAFRFGPSGLVDAIGPLPAAFSTISGVANGVAVGSFVSSADSRSHALTYTDAAGSVDLNDVIPADSGWVLLDATAVNAAGQIVGDGLFQGTPRSFLLTPATPRDTTPPVISLVTATPSIVTPPNGQMASIAVSVAATDNSNAAPVCQISHVSGPGTAGVDYLATGPLAASVRATGGSTYTVTVTCADAAGNTSSASVLVSVPRDTTPPVISKLSVSPSNIWPPDHKLVPVTVSVTATDNVDAAPVCGLSGISSKGPGPTAGDWVITGPLSAKVRADGGRVYTLTATCADSAGNRSSASVTLQVAHDVTPPVIRRVSVSPDIIWPLSKRLVNVLLKIEATDDSGEAPRCRITGIGSSEVDPGDRAITGPFTAMLKAWHLGVNRDRVYSLTVTCTDGSGNSSHVSVPVTVPHDHR
ncbi:MAG: hypothetical protein ACRD1V_14265 [Vicinamibacterales bacterium]